MCTRGEPHLRQRTVDQNPAALHHLKRQHRGADVLPQLVDEEALTPGLQLGHVHRALLRTRSTADRVSIEVEDGCGGLLPGAAETIFRPFEQWGGDRTGMGLGLTISRQAIEADGGRISVRDVAGKGCVFIVEMPLALGEPGESVSRGSSPLEPSLAPR